MKRFPITASAHRSSQGMMAAALTVISMAACQDLSPTTNTVWEVAPSADHLPPTFAWFAPLGTGVADPSTFADDAAPTVEICPWNGTACSGAVIARFGTVPGPGIGALTVDAAAGEYSASWNLLSSAFTTRRTYRIRALVGTTERLAVSVDVVRGRWALTREGSPAPLVSANQLAIRFGIQEARHTTVTQLVGLPYPGLLGIPTSINAGGIIVGMVGGSGDARRAQYFSPPRLIHEVQPIPGDPCSGSYAERASINDGGQTAGIGGACIDAGGGFGSFIRVYGPGGSIAGPFLQPLPGATSDWGGYLNNANEVVGHSYFTPSNIDLAHATLWLGGVPTDLGNLGDRGVEPLAMAPNRSGADRIIVGRSPTSPPFNDFSAVQWRNGSWSLLQPRPGCVRNFTQAFDVADNGMVVGQERWCGGDPVLWIDGQFRSLAPECGQAHGLALQSGAAKAITLTPAGRVLIAGDCGGVPAVWYDDGHGGFVCELLPLLSGDDRGEAVDVNPSGVIVGSSFTFGGPSHPVRWDFVLPPIDP
jgi:hypothetical protein